MAAAARAGRSIRFSLTTNATLLTPADAALFAAYPFTVAVSIDGDREGNDAVRRMRSGASALSLMTSTAVPPAPNTITGPKVGSSAMPRMSSRAFGFTTMACTITPEIRASGRCAFARDRISAVALRTASALVRLSTTPPTSDL